LVAGVLTAVAVLWPKPAPRPVSPDSTGSTEVVPKPPAPSGPIDPAAMIPPPLPAELQVRYALPIPSGDLGSTGLRTPDAREMTEAERDFFARVQRGSLHVDELVGRPALQGPGSGFRGATIWDEFLERWVDPRLKRNTGLGIFRPDATYEAVRLPFQQEESGFSLGLKYRWTF
jgi:hypothetical protein